MGEIKTDLYKLKEGSLYVAGPNEYVIRNEHTLSDVLRYLISQAGEDGHKEIQYLLDEYKESI